MKWLNAVPATAFRDHLDVSAGAYLLKLPRRQPAPNGSALQGMARHIQGLFRSISPRKPLLIRNDFRVKLSQPRVCVAITSKNELVNVNFDMNKKPQTPLSRSRCMPERNQFI
ncbi:hypothetical protein [Variovorax gossypii]|uniref:hypothetical protein n=1 Tax=Variovorax gossypii TaxID=1679495 RepID=UPI000F838A61|nr:hypothetical protein [Variovorax gossypii]